MHRVQIIQGWGREGGVEKVQKEREKGNQGRLDTPCSFPTLGRWGANRSDQIHFPESIFCFVNTLGQPFPAHSFSPSFSCPFPAFKPPFFSWKSVMVDACRCEQTCGSWRGWQSVCKCAEIPPCLVLNAVERAAGGSPWPRKTSVCSSPGKHMVL